MKSTIETRNPIVCAPQSPPSCLLLEALRCRAAERGDGAAVAALGACLARLDPHYPVDKVFRCGAV